MADHDELKYQGEMLRWEAMYRSYLESDLAAVQIGLFVLKAVISVNGAALIAALAAYPPMRNISSFQALIPVAGQLFVLGLISGLLAAGTAYFYQSFVTAKLQNDMFEAYPKESEKPPSPCAYMIARILAIPMIGLTFISAILFAFGCWKLLGALAPS